MAGAVVRRKPHCHQIESIALDCALQCDREFIVSRIIELCIDRGAEITTLADPVTMNQSLTVEPAANHPQRELARSGFCANAEAEVNRLAAALHATPRRMTMMKRLRIVTIFVRFGSAIALNLRETTPLGLRLASPRRSSRTATPLPILSPLHFAHNSLRPRP